MWGSCGEPGESGVRPRRKMRQEKKGRTIGSMWGSVAQPLTISRWTIRKCLQRPLHTKWVTVSNREREGGEGNAGWAASWITTVNVLIKEWSHHRLYIYIYTRSTITPNENSCKKLPLLCHVLLETNLMSIVYVPHHRSTCRPTVYCMIVCTTTILLYVQYAPQSWVKMTKKCLIKKLVSCQFLFYVFFPLLWRLSCGMHTQAEK